MAAESGVVKYYRNGTLLYTSTQAPTLPLRADTSLYSTGDALLGATLAGTLVDVSSPTGEAVVWVSAVGVSVAAGSITKTAPTAWGNAGAASSRGINGDGYVEVTLPATPGYAMFGLANGDTDQGWADIDFALYTYAGNGKLQIYEKGTYCGSFEAYAPGDKLKVAAESGVVKYYRNGTLLYTSTQAPILPLRADTSLYSTGTALLGATLAGTLVDVSSPTGEAVVWVSAVGVSVAAGSITKTAPTAWGNAGAASSRGINGDGYVEVTLPATPGYAMFGLANGDTDQGWADIDFALYTYAGNGKLQIYEKGTYRGSFEAYAPGDKLKVAVGVRRGQVLPQRHSALHVHSGPHPPAEGRHLTVLDGDGPSRRDVGGDSGQRAVGLLEDAGRAAPPGGLASGEHITNPFRQVCLSCAPQRWCRRPQRIRDTNLARLYYCPDVVHL